MPKIIAATVAQHREQTYQALLDAVDALIVDRGLDAVSMRDIAERAGVSRTAIYNYASDKMSLLAASVERTAASLHSAVTAAALEPGKAAPERLEEIMHLLLTFAHSAQNLLMLRALHASPDRGQRWEAISAYQDDLGRHLRALIAQGIEAGDYAPVADLDLTVDMLTGVVDVAVVRVVERPDDIDAVTTSTVTFLQRALGKRD
jgi:AcrR family transcriptional regulator